MENKRSDDYFNQIWDNSKGFSENVYVEEPKDFNTRETVVPKKLSDNYKTLATYTGMKTGMGKVGSLPLKTKYKKAYFQIIDSVKEEFSSRFQQNDFVMLQTDVIPTVIHSWISSIILKHLQKSMRHSLKIQPTELRS